MTERRVGAGSTTNETGGWLDVSIDPASVLNEVNIFMSTPPPEGKPGDEVFDVWAKQAYAMKDGILSVVRSGAVSPEDMLKIAHKWDNNFIPESIRRPEIVYNESDLNEYYPYEQVNLNGQNASRPSHRSWEVRGLDLVGWEYSVFLKKLPYLKQGMFVGLDHGFSSVEDCTGSLTRDARLGVKRDRIGLLLDTASLFDPSVEREWLVSPTYIHTEDKTYHPGVWKYMLSREPRIEVAIFLNEYRDRWMSGGRDTEDSFCKYVDRLIASRNLEETHRLANEALRQKKESLRQKKESLRRRLWEEDQAMLGGFREGLS